MLKSDFRFYIKRELQRRLARNPSYSLRAFARDIKMSPQNLSQVLSGRTGLSPKSAVGLAEALQLNPKETERFVALINAKHARSRVLRDQALRNLEALESRHETKEIKDEKYRTLTHWNAWAAYLLTELKSFEPNLEWAAQRLRLPINECKSIYDELFEKEFLTETKAKRWQTTQRRLSFAAAESVKPVRDFYRSVLTRAMEAIESEPVEARSFNMTLMALSPDDVIKLQARIDEFADAISEEFADASPDADRVYALGLFRTPLDYVGAP